MTREIQAAILRACGRYMRKALEPIEKRLGELEQRAMREGPPGRDGKDGRDGIDGKDAEPIALEDVTAALLEADELRTLVDLQVAESVAGDAIAAAVAKHLEANPPAAGRDGRDGKDGTSVSMEDVERMVQVRVDGWALDFERRAQGVLERAVERMPKPADGKDGRDGVDGKDGADGFSLEDLVIEDDGERCIKLRFVRGELVREREVRFPNVIDRGVYRHGELYQRGDGVTFTGSWWIAQKDAPKDKPGQGDGWRLAVKRGRDGKDGKDGERGPEGKAAPAYPRHGGPY